MIRLRCLYALSPSTMILSSLNTISIYFQVTPSSTSLRSAIWLNNAIKLIRKSITNSKCMYLTCSMLLRLKYCRSFPHVALAFSNVYCMLQSFLTPTRHITFEPSGSPDIHHPLPVSRNPEWEAKQTPSDHWGLCIKSIYSKAIGKWTNCYYIDRITTNHH